jgi:hypothetical protein
MLNIHHNLLVQFNLLLITAAAASLFAVLPFAAEPAQTEQQKQK